MSQLRRELAEKETQLSARTSEKTADDELSWLDVLSHDINENVEERINLQKALFELEDTNLHNRAELQQLDELIAEGQVHNLQHWITRAADVSMAFLCNMHFVLFGKVLLYTVFVQTSSKCSRESLLVRASYDILVA